MKRSFFLFLSTLSIALVGCTVGPNYKKPFISVPSAWHNKTPQSSGLLGGEDIEWWGYFNDPLLKTLIQEAAVEKAENFDVQLAVNKIKQARAGLNVTQSGLMPGILGVANYTHTHPSLTSGQNSSQNSSQNFSQSFGQSSGNSSSQNNDLFKFGFDVSWEMDIFGGVRRAVESQGALLQASVENSRAVFLLVVSQIAQSYVIYRNTQNQLDLQNNIVQTLKSIYLFQRDLLQSGFVSELDVAAALTNLSQAEARLSALDTALKTTLYDLSTLVGKTPVALLERLRPLQKIPTVETVVFSCLPSTLIQHRPDIQQAERQLASATANIGVSMAQLFPVFELTGLFSLNSSAANNLFTSKSSYVSAGPGLSLPIFSFGKIQSQIDLQTALQEESFITYKQSIMTALKEVETALVNFNNTDVQLKREMEHKKSLSLSYSLIESRHKGGLETALTVYQSKILYLGAQQQYLDTLSARSLSVIQLYKALGGGWKYFKNKNY